MNWKFPPTKLFWVPVPYNPEKRLFELVEYQYSENKPKQTIEITDPETSETKTFEILDFLGTYPIAEIPNFLARQCTDNPTITGDQLFYFLQKKKPEFKLCEKVIFLQLTAKTNNEEGSKPTA